MRTPKSKIAELERRVAELERREAARPIIMQPSYRPWWETPTTTGPLYNNTTIPAGALGGGYGTITANSQAE